ncbi:unnamed protein product [Rotaria sordida]|uniref:Beta-lactamase-related domain-containing protein n=1 Tax=Rotaria sordida TaxID=392033 RepID=A0A819JSI1_9BILA|nr:unnamed protein product [Rotaria sordida]
MSTTFEALPDEILMIILQYSGNVYNIFRTFSGLNKRLNNILVDRRLHLLTDFLYMHYNDKYVNYYYNSAVFHNVSQQLLSIIISENDKVLRQCFQSLVIFHIKEKTNRLKDKFKCNIEHFQSIRLLLTNDETRNIDEELKNSLKNLKNCPISIKNIEQIVSLILTKGARLEYNDSEFHEFNLAKAINGLLLAKLNSIEYSTQRLINSLVQMFKSLIISNPNLLQDQDWFYYDGYSVHFFLYCSMYQINTIHSDRTITSINMECYQAILDLLLYTIQFLKHLFRNEVWAKIYLLDIFNMITLTNVVTKHEIFIEASQIEILNIILNEYSLEDKILFDKEFNDMFQQILDNLIENNRVHTLLLIYHANERIRNLFQNSWNNEKYVNIMTKNRITRQFFHALLNDELLRTWLTSTDLLFVLLQKKEYELVKKLLKLSPSLVYQCDDDGNDPLFYVCLNVPCSMLQCFECEPKNYNFLITPDNVPSTFNCTIIVTPNKFCSLDIWTTDNGTKSDLRVNIIDTPERRDVPYVLTGFTQHNSGNFSTYILYHCLTDKCNNPEVVLKRLLESTTTEIKPPSRSSVDQSQLPTSIECFIYSNFTNSSECKPARRKITTEKEDCSFCTTFINIDPNNLLTERVCSYCENSPQSIEKWRFIDGRIHLLNDRVSYLDYVSYVCNTTNNCNSLENIKNIQNTYKIEFNFDKFLGPISIGNSLVAIAAALCVQRGLLDYSAPVTRYWPEYGQRGKENTTVADILSHRAGVPNVLISSFDQYLNWTTMIDLLEQERPVWIPGHAQGYHALTYGWLAGELIRRVDPQKRTIGEFIREEIADPIQTEFYIGLPQEFEQRVSPLILTDVEGILNSSMLTVFRFYNEAQTHQAEIPAANGITNARSLARIFASLIGNINDRKDSRLLQPEILQHATTSNTLPNETDIILQISLPFGMGFALYEQDFPMFGPKSFGHSGKIDL